MEPTAPDIRINVSISRYTPRDSFQFLFKRVPYSQVAFCHLNQPLLSSFALNPTPQPMNPNPQSLNR